MPRHFRDLTACSLIWLFISQFVQSQPSDDFQWLARETLAKLPEQEGAMWRDFIRTSNAKHLREVQFLEEECNRNSIPKPFAAPSNSREFEVDVKVESAWFGGPEATQLAEVIISFQTPTGAWSKSVDYSKGPRVPGMHWTSQTGNLWHYCGTLDNRSTTEQIRFLARVYGVTKRQQILDSLTRAVDWLLEAQYPSGGWPQNYPVESGYHEAITLNDNAMLHALELLLDISQARMPFEFMGDESRSRAQNAFERGLRCLEAAQIRLRGQPTVWCAQHHPITLEPVAARKKEPPSLSGGESAELLKLLMRRCPKDAQTMAMVEAGLQWFDEHRITGLRKIKIDLGKTDYVADLQSTEIYWARFYDIATGKPIFAGAQDGIIYETYSDMAAKNKVAYDYFTTKPHELLTKEVDRWKKRR